MLKKVPSKLIRELGPIASGQLKVLATCCVESCPNEVEINLNPAGQRELKTDRAFFDCSFHRATTQTQVDRSVRSPSYEASLAKCPLRENGCA